jgi:PPK2 family polyphosphate:nucleotide phosphotransferase
VIPDHVFDDLRVEPGTKARLRHRDSARAFADELKDGDENAPKAEARALLDQGRAELAAAQDLLHAAGTHAVLVVLQGMDAAGKDGTIKHVLSGVNPQGCRVWSFKQPTPEERAHDFLWRYAWRAPERGTIGIFNRSHYEDVIVVRVHPALLGSDRPADPDRFWAERYEDINGYERHLTRAGTVVLKFFLHISAAEQRRRLLKRVDDPAKHWKFSATDLAERAYWADYEAAYEDALTATSTEWAPWYVVPADHKWAARALVAGVLARTVRGLGLKYPTLNSAQEAALTGARAVLERETRATGHRAEHS